MRRTTRLAVRNSHERAVRATTSSGIVSVYVPPNIVLVYTEPCPMFCYTDRFRPIGVPSRRQMSHGGSAFCRHFAAGKYRARPLEVTPMPNLSVNADAPCAWLRPRSGSPVTFVR
jgi:hypothetical protein